LDLGQPVATIKNWMAVCFMLVHVVAGARTGMNARAAPAHYAGWAVEAYPELSAVQMAEMVERISRAGANVIWIGHNNPGEVTLDKPEPGLSYAVYEAAQDASDPRHDAALAIVQAQHRMLRACRAAGVRAVLPVGYQIQMGQVWNTHNPDALRRDAAGSLLDIFGGGVSASFYSPSYRQAIEAYYRWVESEFVTPYADVLLMLNLADEPIGGDYSAYAEAEFRRRSGFGFADVGESSDRQRLLGAFQSQYIVEYATFSARLWQTIHPGLPVTMSFDGGQARKAFALPDVEALFRDTPSNLVITFDAYPHDGLPEVPASDADLTGLFLLVRSLGAYSAHYGKQVWLWAAANSWGLGQPSPDPGTISDAVANGLSLALLLRQGGGDLQGIVYWNYNVKAQGLYNDTNHPAYSPDAMFRSVSEMLPTLRRLMDAQPSQPDVLILAPSAWVHQQIGAAHEAVRLEAYPFGQLTLLAQAGARAAIVGELSSRWLSRAKTVLVLGTTADALSAGDRMNLQAFLARGGKVVASPELGAALAGGTFPPSAAEASQAGRPTSQELIVQRGNLFIAQLGLAELLGDRWRSLVAPLWQQLLGVEPIDPVYRILTDEVAFYYRLGPEPVTWQLRFPFDGEGYRYDAQGRPVEWVQGPYEVLTLGRREYALIWRVHLGRWRMA
jgi:hypothetical protein